MKIKDVGLDAKLFKLIAGTTTRVIEAVPSGQQREIEYTYVPQAGATSFTAQPARITYSPVYGQGHITQVRTRMLHPSVTSKITSCFVFVSFFLDLDRCSDADQGSSNDCLAQVALGT